MYRRTTTVRYTSVKQRPTMARHHHKTRAIQKRSVTHSNGVGAIDVLNVTNRVQFFEDVVNVDVGVPAAAKRPRLYNSPRQYYAQLQPADDEEEAYESDSSSISAAISRRVSHLHLGAKMSCIDRIRGAARDVDATLDGDEHHVDAAPESPRNSNELPPKEGALKVPCLIPPSKWRYNTPDHKIPRVFHVQGAFDEMQPCILYSKSERKAVQSIGAQVEARGMQGAVLTRPIKTPKGMRRVHHSTPRCLRFKDVEESPLFAEPGGFAGAPTFYLNGNH